MASYVSVPRDLTKVKSKIIMGLTRRQLICFGAAALIGVPAFFILRKLGNTLAMLGMIAIMMPLFLLAMFEKNGQPFEAVVKNIIRQQFLRPQIRPYRTNNALALEMLRETERKETNALATGTTVSQKR